jgi:indole-3-glycerol phosphate synthase
MTSSSPLPSDLPATLREIVEHKWTEIESERSAETISELESRIGHAEKPRDFFGSLTSAPDRKQTRVIAEVKRRSPSAGLIRDEYASDGFKPEIIANQYSRAGASAISCLTDEKFFGGCLSFIQCIKDAVEIPVLRKDFILDPYQIYQARAYGADAVLLIAECLSDAQIIEMLELCSSLELSTLLEVHSRENLLRVLPILGSSSNKRVLLGINNRDLTRMITDLSHTTDLVDLVEDRSILVSESGIRTNQDLKELRDHDVHIALVGEHLMRQPNPGEALISLLTP